MGIKVVGVNHRTAPLEVRERFAHGAHEVPGALARVMAAGARGGVLLSTCNRTEVYLLAEDEPALDAVWSLLGERLPASSGGGANSYIARS
jgi:glutamyl-tRNA reductase